MESGDGSENASAGYSHESIEQRRAEEPRTRLQLASRPTGSAGAASLTRGSFGLILRAALPLAVCSLATRVEAAAKGERERFESRARKASAACACARRPSAGHSIEVMQRSGAHKTKTNR